MADLKFLMWYIHSEVELYDWYLFKQYYNFSICKISFKKVKVYSWSQLTYSIVIFIARDLYTRTLPIDSRARAAKKFSSKPCRPTGLENRFAQSLSSSCSRLAAWSLHYLGVYLLFGRSFQELLHRTKLAFVLQALIFWVSRKFGGADILIRSIMDVFLMIRRKKMTIFLDAKENTTVLELKRMIEGITKKTPMEQRLYNKEDTVSSFGIRTY